MQSAPGGGGLLDWRWLAVGRDGGVAGGHSGRVYWVDTLVLQLSLQALDVCAQARILALKVLRMATGAGDACNAVCCTTFGVVLRARRAAARLRVAADLPGLQARKERESQRVMQ